MTSKVTAGQRLTADILAEAEHLDLELDQKEIALLARAAVAADRIQELESIVRREGSTFTTKDGVVYPSPLLAELRLQDAVLTRNLRCIKLDAPTASGVDAKKSRAGKASWAARVARHEAKVGGI